MTIAAGTPARLVRPRTGRNVNDPEGDAPFVDAGTVGVVEGPYDGSHEWLALRVVLEVPVRADDLVAMDGPEAGE